MKPVKYMCSFKMLTLHSGFHSLNCRNFMEGANIDCTENSSEAIIIVRLLN